MIFSLRPLSQENSDKELSAVPEKAVPVLAKENKINQVAEEKVVSYEPRKFSKPVVEPAMIVQNPPFFARKSAPKPIESLHTGKK